MQIWCCESKNVDINGEQIIKVCFTHMFVTIVIATFVWYKILCHCYSFVPVVRHDTLCTFVLYWMLLQQDRDMTRVVCTVVIVVNWRVVITPRFRLRIWFSVCLCVRTIMSEVTTIFRSVNPAIYHADRLGKYITFDEQVSLQNSYCTFCLPCTTILEAQKSQMQFI